MRLVRRLGERLALGLCAVLLVGVESLGAQSPASSPQRVNLVHDVDQILAGVAATGNGNAFVLWERRGSGLPLNIPVMALLRSFGPGGESSAPFIALRDRSVPFLHGSLASNSAGELLMTLSRFAIGGFSLRRYGFPQGRQAFWVTTPPLFQDPFGGAVDESGGFVVIWVSRGQEPPDIPNLEGGVYARLYDPKGQPRGRIIHVNTYEKGDQNYPAVAISPHGFVIVWQSPDQDGSGLGVYGQRFAPDGERLGPEFLVPTITAGDQSLPRVAMDSKGGFVVTWTGADPANPGQTAVFARRFDSDGQPLTGDLKVSQVTSDASELASDIAMDASGNFAISWNEWPTVVSFLRLYRANGEPVRDPVPLTRIPSWYSPSISFAGDGTLAAAWTVIAFRPLDVDDVYYQRFSASPGSEACLFHDGEFDCDTGRTGGAPEIRYKLGQAGDIGLLGDLDGDGRADPCVYRTGRFLCDIEHDPGTPPVEIDFGIEGDVPLLGDIDGDGKADPCVYRNQTFLCDPTHQGQATVAIQFGLPGDIPLLGDIDGDGKADPCVYRNQEFLCDPTHQGQATVSIKFGQAGDIPFLGDFDGDGRADPCVYRGGVFLCNTQHSSNGSVSTLALGFGPGAPLLGNIDGL